MVSTHSTQYITDNTPSMTDGKSPLALLAKTCETIGLPDAPPAKKEKKDLSSPEMKKPDSAEKKKERSPTSTPSTSKAEPVSTTYGGLPKTSTTSMPMTFPFGFYPSMLPYMPQFPSFMPFMGRHPCPSALMRQPCVTPGCTFCHDPTSAQATAAQMAAFNPLYAAYAAMMPNTSSAAAMSSMMMNSSPPSAKMTCSWLDNGSLCGKQFTSVEEFTAHMKSHCPPVVSTPSTPVTSTPNKQRFHPYKTTTPVATASQLPLFNPMALQAMYAQRMMMPHP